MKSVDFRANLANRIEHGDEELLSEVLFILDACIYQMAENNLEQTAGTARFWKACSLSVRLVKPSLGAPKKADGRQMRMKR